eukprot:7072482-Prymnesium_polylepis.1
MACTTLAARLSQTARASSHAALRLRAYVSCSASTPSPVSSSEISSCIRAPTSPGAARARASVAAGATSEAKASAECPQS